MHMISLKVRQEHYDFLLRAAQKTDAESLSEYIRSKVLPAAAEDLAEPVPDLSKRPATLPPPGSQAEEIAALNARLASIEGALRTLVEAKAPPPRHGPGLRRIR